MDGPRPAEGVAGPAPAAGAGAGHVDAWFVGHATVRLGLAGVAVLTDPFLRDRLGPLQRHGTAPDPRAVEGIEIVLLSHGHPDHLDAASLATVGPRPLVLVPRGLGGQARRATGGEVLEVVEGASVHACGLVIEVVPARHWITPGEPRAQPVGYLVRSAAGGPTVWFAGDTGRHASMASLRGRVDLALLPVWTWGPHLGPGHLGPRAAAEVLALTGAGAAVPIHWGTLYPRRLHRILRGPLDEPGPRFARHAARLAPHADVRVLAPGERTRFAFGGA